MRIGTPSLRATPSGVGPGVAVGVGAGIAVSVGAIVAVAVGARVAVSVGATTEVGDERAVGVGPGEAAAVRLDGETSDAVGTATGVADAGRAATSSSGRGVAVLQPLTIRSGNKTATINLRACAYLNESMCVWVTEARIAESLTTVKRNIGLILHVSAFKREKALNTVRLLRRWH